MCYAVGDGSDIPPWGSPKGGWTAPAPLASPHTPSAPAPDHLSGLCCSLPICQNLSCAWGTQHSWCSLVNAKYRATNNPFHQFPAHALMKPDTFNHKNPQTFQILCVCVEGMSLIFQWWLRNSVSHYQDSGHFRIKHNTILTASGQELAPPHSLMLWVVLNALSIQTSRNLIQRQMSAPGGREHVHGAAPALLGDPGLASQKFWLPSFPTVFRRAKCCRLYKTVCWL